MYQDTFAQWFTGPLITPMAITPNPKHPALETTIDFQVTYGEYGDNWSISNLQNEYSIVGFADVQVGFNSVLGMEFLGSASSNFRGSAHSNRLQDTIVRMGFQVLNEDEKTWRPNFRILFEEKFPTGGYNHLAPENLGTDSTGSGSYQSTLFLAFQKLFDLSNGHKYQTRFALGYGVPSSVRLKGHNSYGGGADTDGKLYPGQFINAYMSGEYNLNNRWAIAFDSNYQRHFGATFHGTKGTNTDGSLATIATGDSVVFSFGPELEHVFTENTGMILGSWFTVFGKNTPAFGSVFFTILHVF